MVTDPVRVLHVLQRMEAGGTQAMLMNVYRRIDRSRLQFDFLVEYEESQFYDKEIESLGGRIFRTNLRKDGNILRFMKVLKNLIRENDYHIIHVHTYSIGYFALKVAEREGVAVRIAHSHSNSMSGFTVPLKIVMKSLFPIHATNFMACSDEAGRFLFGNRNVLIVKNAIDVGKFEFNSKVRDEVRRELGLEDCFVVGNVGRLHQQKNQAFLLKVFREFIALRSDARLLMVGDGPLREELEEKAEKMGISDRLSLLNNRSDMDRLYQAMDVFVLPSLYEGLGIVALEAQSSGLPTICSDGVAEDANVSPLFRRCSLTDAPIEWANAICNVAGTRDSKIGADGVKAHGFDVDKNAVVLQDWYLREAACVG